MDVINGMICSPTITAIRRSRATGKDHETKLVCAEHCMNLQILQSQHGRAMFAGQHEQSKSLIREREEAPRVLTVKETMLDTNVVNADGTKVSCLGMGLMRSCTFCIPLKQLTPCQSEVLNKGPGTPKHFTKTTDGCTVHKHLCSSMLHACRSLSVAETVASGLLI